jgi:signal transduction histidine kinase
VQSDRDGVQISVKDSGYGIPAKDLPFIFERFYRVQDDSTKDIEGSGLGLAIVKSIVERHGGNVKVESEVGKGSFFMISLPRVWDQEPANIGTTLGSIETG